MKTVLFLAFLASLVSFSLAGLAIDTSSLLSVSEWTCLANLGNEDSIVHIYDPSGQVNQNGIQNIKNAYAASSVADNVIISPCLANCLNNITDPAAQVDTAINALKTSGYQGPGFVWVQIDANQPWSLNQSVNQYFLMSVLNEIVTINGGCGIITNYNAWSRLFGPAFTQASQLAQYLLWVNWNGKMDLTTGFTPFGGWTAPWAHQYAGAITSNNCTNGAAINLSYWDDGTFAKLRSQRKMVKKNKHSQPIA